MEKQDWLDYFEAINGRTPSPEEVAQAYANGEFIDSSQESVQEVLVNSSPSQEPTTEVSQWAQPAYQEPTQQASYQQEVYQEPSYQQGQTFNQQGYANGPTPNMNVAQQQQFQQGPSMAQYAGQFQQGVNQFQNSPQFQDIKTKGRSYFDWFLAALKNPIPQAEGSQFNYGILTVALSALLMGAALVNYFREVFTSIANITVSGESLKVEAPEVYGQLKEAIASNFGLGTLLKISLAIFALYVVIVALPVFINKLSTKSNMDWKYEFGRSSQFLPVLMSVNLFAFVASFLVKNEISVSESSIYSISSLAGEFSSDPLGGISSFTNLVKEIPAIKSIGQVSVYLTVAALVGMIVLVVAFIKNIKVSYKKLNEFYVSIISLVVLLALIGFTDRFIFKTLVESLTQIYDNLYNLF